MDKFIYLRSSVSSIEKYINTRLVKTWAANERLSDIWKSDLNDKTKRIFFFQKRSYRYCYLDALHGHTLNVWRKNLTAITQEYCWKQHPTKQRQYGHLPPITKTIKIRQTRHAGHCWRSNDGLISGTQLWTPSRGRAKAGQPAKTYIKQLCANTGYGLENLQGTMDDRDGWR